jgi:hypothetical protein
LGYSICHFILARLLAFRSNLKDLFSQQRHKAQQTVLKFSSSEAAAINQQATNHYVDHGRKRKRHGHQKPATIARQGQDEEQARQDELLFQAKQGSINPETKRSEWDQGLQRMHPFFVGLQAWP